MKKRLLIILFCILILLVCTGCDLADADGDSEVDNILKKNYTVTLLVDGSENKTITIDDGKALTINYTPRKDDYMFKGWYTNSACTVPYDFSRPVTTNFKLYAGFALKTKTINGRDIKIKSLSSTYDSVGLSLVGFDYDYLEKNGMGLQFRITYKVKYQKDYNMLFDIGYAGAPEYDLSLMNSSYNGYYEDDLTTSTTAVKKSYSFNTPTYFSKDKQVRLKFSTDNVQNIVLISDIVVVIEAIYLS